jgi:3-oxoadipate enol-lactonase
MKLALNGTHLHVELDGPTGGPPVFLGHGIATSGELWAAQVGVLSRRYRVVRLDSRGHGKSDAPQGPYSMAQLADDIAAVIDALGLGAVHYVGLSMGGMIGQEFALRHPGKLRTLALCNTTSVIPPVAPAEEDPRYFISAALLRRAAAVALNEGMKALESVTIDRWFRADFRKSFPAEVQRVRDLFLATSPAGYAGCCHALSTFDAIERISAIKVPTLVISGRHDRGTTVANSVDIHKRIAGSRLVILENNAHISNIEQPTEFAEALLEHLSLGQAD